MTKTKMNSQDLSNRVWFVMKIRQDNNVTNGVYAENDTEQSEPIGLGLYLKWNWTNMTERIGHGLSRKPNKTTT